MDTYHNIQFDSDHDGGSTQQQNYVSDHEKDFLSVGDSVSYNQSYQNGSLSAPTSTTAANRTAMNGNAGNTTFKSSHSQQSSLSALFNVISSPLESVASITNAMTGGGTATNNINNNGSNAAATNTTTNTAQNNSQIQQNNYFQFENDTPKPLETDSQIPWKQEEQQGKLKALEWRTIIFIRHGNSIWNQSTESSFRNPLNTVKALGAFTKGMKEYATYKWKGDEYKHEDSVIVDTPLSPKGMRQAYLLSKFIASHIDLRQEQKLHYLEEHQEIASPIKDAWRSLQQFKMEWIENFNNKTNELNEKSDEFDKLNKSNFPHLCNDALDYLTDAMRKLEVLMAHVPPMEPEYWKIMSKNNDNDNPMLSRSKSMNEIIERHNPNSQQNNNGTFDISQILDLLCGKNIESIIVTSNLRRAISTCVIGLWPRLRITKEKVYLLSYLQEIGANVDTHTSTESFSIPQVSKFEMSTHELDSHSLNEFYKTRLSTVYNYGAKKNGNFGMESGDDTKKRIELFARWCFRQPENKNNNNNNAPIISNNNSSNINSSNINSWDDSSDKERSVSRSATPNMDGQSESSQHSNRKDSSKWHIVNKAKHIAFKKRKSKDRSKNDDNNNNNHETNIISLNNSTIQSESVGINYQNGGNQTLFRSNSHYPDFNSYGQINDNNNSNINNNVIHSQINTNNKINEMDDPSDFSNDELDNHNNDSDFFDDTHVTRIDLSKTDEKNKKSGFATNNDIKNDKANGKSKHVSRSSFESKNGNNNNNSNNNIPPVVIAVGHSKWFKQFFQTFLPSKMDYVGKEAKIANCGVVAFRFYFDPNTNKYGIAPKTLTTIYKGFGES